jgi:hypothetical protein
VYLKDYATASGAWKVKSELQKLSVQKQDEQDWLVADRMNSIDGYTWYLERHRYGKYASIAKARVTAVTSQINGGTRPKPDTTPPKPVVARPDPPVVEVFDPQFTAVAEDTTISVPNTETETPVTADDRSNSATGELDLSGDKINREIGRERD